MLVAVQCTDAEFANFHYYFILVSKFDLGLLNAYKLIYFDRNINGNKDEKILSWVTLGEFSFSNNDLFKNLHIENYCRRFEFLVMLNQ